MALIALASAKGAPGVSTAALALAAVWPQRSILAECDEAGGPLVYRQSGADGQPLHPDRGMLSLSVTARRGLGPQNVWEHVQQLAGGQEVLVGLASAEQAASWYGQWAALGQALAGLEGADTIADLGRLGPASGTLDLLPAASAVLLLSGTRPEELAQLRDRAAALRGRLNPVGGQGPLVAAALVVDSRDRSRAMQQARQLLEASQVPVPVLGVLAHDPEGAEQLAGMRRGRVHKSRLVGSARTLASDLMRELAERQQAVQSAVAAPNQVEAVSS